MISRARDDTSIWKFRYGPNVSLLAATLLMLAGSIPASAGEVSIDEGEGGRLETYISSDTDTAVSFGLFGCGADANEYGFEFLVFVEEGVTVSPFLTKLRETGFSPLRAEVCVGSSCQAPEWTISDYFGAYSGRVLVARDSADAASGLEFKPASGKSVGASFNIKGTFAKICSH